MESVSLNQRPPSPAQREPVVRINQLIVPMSKAQAATTQTGRPAAARGAYGQLRRILHGMEKTNLLGLG